MPHILGLGALLLLPGLRMFSQTIPDQGFFEEGAASLEVKTFPLAVDGWRKRKMATWPGCRNRPGLVIDPGAPAEEILEFIRARL